MHQDPSEKDHFKCDTCKKSFSLKSNLKKHMKLHTSPKKVACPECMMLVGKVNLKHHLRICNKGMKFLSAEEKGKSLHKLFNEFERQYCSVPHKPTRYYLMKKEYINRINVVQQQ